ncbi:MAG TPA: nucleotide pyrophosphatase/phosphodiesterase family protein [Tepidisphaeraceae bacterium]|nr:nucleotide pyrophosphatase/phosphodiesterase family protein [Tepidisphaeraceae bacterium]
MHKTVVMNAVGLTPRLISPQHTPRIHAFVHGATGGGAGGGGAGGGGAGAGGAGKLATIAAVLPAVTCSVQSTYLTGAWPSGHGIVGNGWYDRADAEVKFWKQSSHLVARPKVWDAARQRDPRFTCANICWWYAMYSTADYTVTPRPMYPADGRKIPDCWTHPPELRDQLQRELGPFPLFKFWGPATDVASTQWIADAAIRVDERHDPTLTLIYLPHLDYVLQRHGPGAPEARKDLRELDAVVGKLLDRYAHGGARVILLSEYGITPVTTPVHLNRALRQNGLLAVRQEMGRELLDPGASAAFAVADHQVAHVYVNDRSKLGPVRSILENVAGVARVLDDAGKRELHLDHERAGDLVALAQPEAWFTYYFWLDDARAPDYARTVDIHRKPGYDPAELFIDPAIAAPRLKIAAALARRKLGLRALLDVIPLDATLVKGSHGISPRDPADGAMLATNQPALLDRAEVEPTEVFDLILRHVFD